MKYQVWFNQHSIKRQKLMLLHMVFCRVIGDARGKGAAR